MRRYFFIGLSLLPLSSFAVIPVVDGGAIAKLVEEYNQLKSQYDLLQRTYQNAQAQLDKQKQIASDVEGHYGQGDILNSASDLKNREWSPDNWTDALKGLSGGNPARYQELVNQYKAANPSLSNDDYKKGASEANAEIYQKQIQTNQAATVNASYAFNDIKTQLDNIHQISQQIEKAPNEKSAIDLGTRMQAELGYVQVQILKQIVLLNEQMARNNADDIASETEAAKFNQLPTQ